MFVLWDDFGSLRITDVEKSKLDLFVGDSSLATGYTYETDIDSGSLQQDQTGPRQQEDRKTDVYIFQDSKNIKLWGVLQNYETVDEDMNEAQIKERGGQMLELYNRPKKSFEVKALLTCRSEPAAPCISGSAPWA